MTTTHLANMSVDITVSDPWEFGTECGVGPFRGRVVAQDTDALAVTLEKPLLYQGQSLMAVVVRPRHVGETVASLGAQRQLLAGLLFSTKEVLSSADFVTIENGVAAIGTVHPR